MPDKIQIERFTRLNQSISGHFMPRQLARLSEFLAADEGKIEFALTGSQSVDRAGGQKRHIKCIISGWFLVADAARAKPEKYDFEIESMLVVVQDSSALPPLDEESEDEDYIVCGSEMNVMERIEEEILLELPSSLIRMQRLPGKSVAKSGGAKLVQAGNKATARTSPFAGLAELKKK